MGKTKVDEEKLNFQISFTLQQAVGRRFVEQCRKDGLSVQNALRFIIQVYLDSKENSNG